MRDEETRRTAVLGLQRLAVVAEGDPCLAVRHVLEWEVGRVAAVAEGGHVIGRGFHVLEKRVDGDSLPDRVELRPLGDAVDVLGHRVGV